MACIDSTILSTYLILRPGRCFYALEAKIVKILFLFIDVRNNIVNNIDSKRLIGKLPLRCIKLLGFLGWRDNEV